MKLQNVLERITARWWFFLLVLFIQFFPPITAIPYDRTKTAEVIYTILGQAYMNQPWLRAAYPALQMVAIVMLAMGFFSHGKGWRVFAFYCAAFFAWVAVVQSVGNTRQFGVGIVTNNLIMMFLVALAWLLEGLVNKSGPRQKSLSPLQWTALLFALLAFWYPVHRHTHQPDFNPVHFFTSPSGTAFCLLTPMILVLLIARYPRVNLVTLRMTSLVGFIIGLYNMLAFFGPNLSASWWNGVLHLPLLTLSFYGLLLGYRRQKPATPISDPPGN